MAKWKKTDDDCFTRWINEYIRSNREYAEIAKEAHRRLPEAIEAFVRDKDDEDSESLPVD
jgi:hypothetical protein